MVQELTRATILKIDLTGATTVVTCTVCAEHIEFAQTGEFRGVVVRRFYAHNKLITLRFKTGKAYCKDFLEVHYGLHNRQKAA